MSNEEKKSKRNTIRYLAIAVVALIVLAALAFLVLTQTEGNFFGEFFGEPQASIRIDGYEETVYIYHEGGDPLDMGKIRAARVVIDGSTVNIPSEQLKLFSGTGWTFATGNIISTVVTEYERPSTLILWYEGRGGLRELTRGELTPKPTPVPTQMPVVTHTIVPEVQQTPSQSIEPGVVQIWPIGSQVTQIPTFAPVTIPITFDVSTTSGEQPLTVQFRDTTQGCIVERLWEFGDGAKDTERITSHKYAYPGTYMATLSVTFCDDFDSPAAFQQIFVHPIAREDSYITGFKGATILPGGMLDFIVKNGVELRVGGRLYPLKENDAVRIELKSGGHGAITIMGNVIIDLVIPTSALYVNGEEIARGNVVRTNGITFSNLAISDLSLHVSPGPSAEITGIVNGYNVISPNKEYGYFISNIGQDSTNKLILDAKEQRFVLQAGIKGITQVTAG